MRHAFGPLQLASPLDTARALVRRSTPAAILANIEPQIMRHCCLCGVDTMKQNARLVACSNWPNLCDEEQICDECAEYNGWSRCRQCAQMLCAHCGFLCRICDDEGSERSATAYVDTMALRFVTGRIDSLLRVTDESPTVCLDEKSATVYVDTMALRFVTGRLDGLLRVTDESPAVCLEAVSGAILVDKIGVLGMNVQDRRGRWHHLEVPEAHYCKGAKSELYPVQYAFAVLRCRHSFDDVNEIRMPEGSRVPFGSTPEGFHLQAVYGPPIEGAILHRPRGAIMSKV